MRIQLENWRNFRRVDIELGDRVFLVGPNASGKSNFLDAFRFLHDIVRTRGGFQPAVELRGGVSNLRYAAAPSGSDVRVAVTIGTDDQPNLWEYDICFNESRHLGPLLKTEKICHAEVCELTRPIQSDRQDPLSLTQTFLEQVSQNQKFRAIAEFLSMVFYLHIVPQLVREPERSAGQIADPFGGDFLKQVDNVPSRLRTARLHWICKVIQAAVPSLETLDIEHDTRGVPHLRGRFQPGGHWKSEMDFSDGTLRLIGLLWAHLVSPSGPLILEEPELSLHPEVVRYLPQMLARMQNRRGQQILLSTHSPDLLRDEGIGLDEVLLFIPTEEGTVVRPASSFEEIVALLEGGVDLPDAVLPSTRPAAADQLARRIGR
jgi:hypothetical protein